MREVDVVVIGGGPAGIAAAVRAADGGRSVVVLDEGLRLGGQIWRHRDRATLPLVAQRWLARFDASSAVASCGSAVVDVFRRADGFVVTAEQDGVAFRMRGRSIILATGARERFLPFPGWTLPGVIGIGGAQALLKAGTSFAGKRVVIAGSGPLLLPVAASLATHGATVVLVAEQAPALAVMGFGVGLLGRPATMFQAARYRAAFAATPYRFGEWAVEAYGSDRVESVMMSTGRTIACDVLATAFGLVPNTELARLVGCAVSPAGVLVGEAQQTSVANVYCAGETTGIGGVDLALVEGEIAGLHASGRSDAMRALVVRRTSLRAMAVAMERAFAPRAELRRLAGADTIVCRCEDVSAGAIDPSWTARQAKLYTRAGMGPCQGRVCGAALEFLYGWAPDSVRLPAEPASMQGLAGAAGAGSGSLRPEKTMVKEPDPLKA